MKTVLRPDDAAPQPTQPIGWLRGMLHRWLLWGLRPERLLHRCQPTDVGVPAQAVVCPALTAVDGAALFAWFIRPDGPPGRRMPALVAMHGWGSNASELLPGAEALRRAGLALLLIDARCHGLSGEAEFTSMPRFAQDLECGLDWLQRQPDVDPDRIVLIGHSVGAAAALLLASRRPDVHGVVSLSAFAHPADVMRRWMRERRIPMWPVGHWVLAHVQTVIGARFDDIAPEHTLRSVRAPVMLVHGEDDEVAPVSDLQRLLVAGRGRDVTALTLPGVGHDLSVVLTEAVLPGLLGFLDSLGKARPAQRLV